ncbi:unnamed protein product [marine sediment metagenome]|uniref:Uncharacterized protein n=1 Tax=marine sediment metagenome TaxID=412755 RepID=X1B8Q4_9ZZZZ
MFKLLHEIELNGDSLDGPTYLYIEADEDLEIDINKEDTDVTHITTIDTDIGVTPDLIITRRSE